jgi:hypothetical protein
VILILILGGGAKGVVKKYLKAMEANDKATADLTVTSSKKARKALELDKKDKDEDDDDEVNWKVTDSKNYSGKDDAFKGLKNYVAKNMDGNEENVSKMAIVEVKTWGSDKDKAEYLYFTCIKVKGNWYILRMENGSKDTKIKTIANKWAEYADKKSSSDDDD